jgi:hypothetical protein
LSLRGEVEVATYRFSRWEDGSTNSSRTIAVTADMSITAYYVSEMPPSGCFIATAAYGTPLAQEISVLRQFRDNFMDVTSVGRKLAETYYRISPPIARAIAQHDTLRAVVRVILKPIVQLLQK